MNDKLQETLKLYQQKVEELQILIDRARAISDITVSAFLTRNGPLRTINMLDVFDFMFDDCIYITVNGQSEALFLRNVERIADVSNFRVEGLGATWKKEGYRIV